MKANGYLFAFIFVFLVICDAIYWPTSHDPTGTTALAFAAMLAFLVSYYLLFTARRMALQPEDDDQADIEDGAGEVGFFSPHSQWPIMCAAAASLVGLGLIFGWWLFLIGVACVIPCAWGMLFEYYRQDPEVLVERARQAEASGEGHGAH